MGHKTDNAQFNFETKKLKKLKKESFSGTPLFHMSGFYTTSSELSIFLKLFPQKGKEMLTFENIFFKKRKEEKW